MGNQAPNLQSKSVPATALRFAVSACKFGDNGADAKTVPVTMTARTGDPICHWYWGNVVHDLSGMTVNKDRLPVDYCHESDEVLGYLNKFDPSSGDLIVSGALTPFEDGDRASEVIYKQKAGVPYEASIDFTGPTVVEYVDAGASTDVNGKTLQGPLTVFRKWVLRGVAICPYGADPNTSTEFKAGDKTVEVATFQTQKLSSGEATPPAPAVDPAAPKQLAAGEGVPAPVDPTGTPKPEAAKLAAVDGDKGAEAAPPAPAAPAVESPAQLMLDIAKANGSDPVVGLIDETTKAHPELTLGAARTIKGINYKTLVRTSLFNGTTFRSANEGATVGKATYENRLVETFILNPRWEADKAVADSYEDGARVHRDGSREHGRKVDGRPLRPVLLRDQHDLRRQRQGLPRPDRLLRHHQQRRRRRRHDRQHRLVSVWLVKFGPKAVQWVWGRTGSCSSPTRASRRSTTPTATPLTGYVQDLLARPGLQVGSIRSLVRIKKLTADSGKGLTDTLISRRWQVRGRRRAGRDPHVRRSRHAAPAEPQRDDLQRRRRQGDQRHREHRAHPRPAFGIPIAVTDAIKDTEALTL
jgi:hypothetical protein